MMVRQRKYHMQESAGINSNSGELGSSKEQRSFTSFGFDMRRDVGQRATVTLNMMKAEDSVAVIAVCTRVKVCILLRLRAVRAQVTGVKPATPAQIV